jgi:hypothetical protein
VLATTVSDAEDTRPRVIQASEVASGRGCPAPGVGRAHKPEAGSRIANKCPDSEHHEARNVAEEEVGVAQKLNMQVDRGCPGSLWASKPVSSRLLPRLPGISSGDRERDSACAARR